MLIYSLFTVWLLVSVTGMPIPLVHVSNRGQNASRAKLQLVEETPGCVEGCDDDCYYDYQFEENSDIYGDHDAYESCQDGCVEECAAGPKTSWSTCMDWAVDNCEGINSDNEDSATLNEETCCGDDLIHCNPGWCQNDCVAKYPTTYVAGAKTNTHYYSQEFSACFRGCSSKLSNCKVGDAALVAEGMTCGEQLDVIFKGMTVNECKQKCADYGMDGMSGRKCNYFAWYEGQACKLTEYCWRETRFSPKNLYGFVLPAGQVTKIYRMPASELWDYNCPMETGYCANGVRRAWGTRIGDFKEDTAAARVTCLVQCKNYKKSATGCEAREGDGCYVHTSPVTQGNGDAEHHCWIFSKCSRWWI